MKSKDEISKGPKKRDPTCLQLQHDIIIPAGTILRQHPGKAGKFSCPAEGGDFAIDEQQSAARPGIYRKVIA